MNLKCLFVMLYEKYLIIWKTRHFEWFTGEIWRFSVTQRVTKELKVGHLCLNIINWIKSEKKGGSVKWKIGDIL